MPYSEMTITLQDMTYQMGLNVDGNPVSGALMVGGMLFPDASDSRVHMRWLPLFGELRSLWLIILGFSSFCMVVPLDVSCNGL
ncbi:hypothetical protein Ahy_B05g078069 [Arachis hypogaea]|uniref:Uncharacterized protein n=1 Tax=Arachis hypogaea TaxID=3818 RepID=A0A444Z686_ARAHY|nr:hypothetical protein Ahy_B05g078069 [Arachis hypogaea]